MLLRLTLVFLLAHTLTHAQTPPHILILGGGNSHDFTQHYAHTDTATLNRAGLSVQYADTFRDLPTQLRTTNAFIQASNHTAPSSAARLALMEFVAHGGGLVVLHAGTWYNWPEWPDYNRLLVGGGTRDHDAPAPFEVTVTDPRHPIMAGVPARFIITDELYHQEIQQIAPDRPSVQVLATAHSPLTGKDYPAVWIVTGQPGRIVGITLGHDERAHTNAAYQTLLTNSARWAAAPHPLSATHARVPSQP